MTLYSIILFVHVTAVLTLFAALSFEVLSLFHLRRSANLNEIRRWIDVVPGQPLVAAGTLLIILLSGIYLTIRMSAFELAWPKVTLGTFLLIAPFGALSGRRIGAIRRASAATKRFDSDLLGLVRDPLLKISLSVRVVVLLGIVLLMAAKPGLWVSIGIVGASLVLGLLTSLVRGQPAAGQKSGSEESPESLASAG
jgi:hypothetical protein